MEPGSLRDELAGTFGRLSSGGRRTKSDSACWLRLEHVGLPSAGPPRDYADSAPSGADARPTWTEHPAQNGIERGSKRCIGFTGRLPSNAPIHWRIGSYSRA